MAKEQEQEVDLTDLNHSELVLLAQWNGLNASRAVPRDEILNALQTLQPLPYKQPFEEQRQKLSAWSKRWWKAKLRMQADRRVCPRCALCPGALVLLCFQRNQINIERK
jgi:hypothetical protein